MKTSQTNCPGDFQRVKYTKAVQTAIDLQLYVNVTTAICTEVVRCFRQPLFPAADDLTFVLLGIRSVSCVWRTRPESTATHVVVQCRFTRNIPTFSWRPIINKHWFSSKIYCHLLLIIIIIIIITFPFARAFGVFVTQIRETEYIFKNIQQRQLPKYAWPSTINRHDNDPKSGPKSKPL